MPKFDVLESKTMVLPTTNIDTDQIIPARFLKVTDKKGLGKVLFSDWRYRDGEENPDFILNRPEARGAQVLVAGDNFGCGSSREHAPWALVDYGIRAVISTTIADIFRNNAMKNGLLPIVVSPEFHAHLMASPGSSIKIDLEACTVTAGDGKVFQFTVEPFARYCLLRGLDQLDFLMDKEDEITAYEEKIA